MNSKQAASLNIGISIIFAIAIVLSNYFLDGSPYDQTVTYALIALWFIPFSLLAAIGTRKK